MTERVYLHVGLPKTGTTYLQRTIWRSREQLAETGVLLPGPGRRFHRLAAWDLLGRRLRGVRQAEVPGSWQRLVQLVSEGGSPLAVLSEEFLVHCRPRHIRRIVTDFAPAEVHIIVTVRDLGRVIGSAWQQEVLKGRSWDFTEFLTAVRYPDQGPPTAGVGFWLRYDPRRLLAEWSAVVPQERIHIVLVPPPTAGPLELLTRFASVLEVPVETLTPAESEANASLGLVATEVLRRLNPDLRGTLNERQYRYAVDRLVRPALRHVPGAGTPIGLPPAELDWVCSWTDDLVSLLARSRYDIVGDLDDLQSKTVTAATAAVSEAELFDATVHAWTTALRRQARTWARSHGPVLSAGADPAVRLASGNRAVVYRAKVTALDRADRNHVLALLANRYLHRTRRRPPPGGE